MVYLMLICFLCFGCSTTKKVVHNSPISSVQSVLPSISSDSDSQIIHPSLPEIKTEYKSISSKSEGGSKKWGESIAHWSIKRDELVVGDGAVVKKEEEVSSFFFTPNSGVSISPVFAENFSKKVITVPMPVMEEEVIGNIIEISKLEDRPKSNSWVGVCLIAIIFSIIGLMTYKNHHRKYKENGNPFLEIKKKKAAVIKTRKPSRKK